jgi:cell wall-associated NlpC family hydrolase
MRDKVSMIKEAIATAEKRHGLDWRTSWSKAEAGPDGSLRVFVSRGEVFAELGEYEGVETELAGASSPSVLQAVSSVVDVRRQPEHSSELLTQAIMGETMTRLDSRGDWYLVVLEDGYHGWVRSWNVGELPREEAAAFARRADAMVSSSVGYVLSEPGEGSIPVSDITAGTLVAAGEERRGFTGIELPGGRSGYISSGSLEPLPKGAPSREGIIERAMGFLGIPYIWGGTSAKGFDCSGLVKRVLRMEGIETMRDADQQSSTGSAVEGKGAAELPPASLLFFGEGGRITHVAINIGGGRFIHSYGDVRVNSLLETDNDYEVKLAEIYLFARDLLTV